MFWFDRQCHGVCARDCAVLTFHPHFVLFCLSSVYKHHASVLFCVCKESLTLSEFISVHEVSSGAFAVLQLCYV